MNIQKELNSLPNFCYTLEGNDGKLHYAILGGQSCIECENPQYIDIDYIIKLNGEMRKIYEKDKKDEKDKIELAKLMKRMLDFCDFRIKGVYSREEQNSYIDKLNKQEYQEISYQIQMYKDAREYYRDYDLRHKLIT